MVYDPELAPPPDPDGDRRLLRIIGALTVLLVIGLGFAFYERTQLSPKVTSAAKGFLKDVQGRNFTAASSRLCPGTKITAVKLTTDLGRAAARGHGLRSYKVVSGYTSQAVAGGGTAHVAQADATFTNGQTGVVTILIRSSNGRDCVFDPGTDLF
jgi:hypothetical protein